MATVREIKAAIAASGATWRVDPSLQDDREPPRYALGGESKARIPAHGSSARMFRARPRASSVDWRNRNGQSWVTGVRDQNPCDACWAFAVTALVESAVRIEHSVWCVRSEGDIHDGLGAKCGSIGNPGSAIGWIKENGIADPGCWAWTPADEPYVPSADRGGRTVKLDDVSDVWIGNAEDQKHWIDTVGPIVCSIDCFEDFDVYHGGPYRHVAGAYRGWHIMLCVGYDDANGWWIVKNQWGTGWGDQGYAYICYDEVKIDENAKIGLRGTNPDGWLRRRLHGGNLLESGNGATHRNFELVTRLSDGRISHWQRDNSLPDFPWRQPWVFGEGDAAGPPALIESSYGGRNLELVYRTNARRLRHWYFDSYMMTWNDGGIFGPSDVAGEPAFIQSNYGVPGNFEVVFRAADGRLDHWYRPAGGSWTQVGRFGSNVRFSGPALVQTQAGGQRNFELICVLGSGVLQHWTRNNDANTGWQLGRSFGANVQSGACMLEGQYGATDERTPGNLELCVAVGGRAEHWWFDHVQPAAGWRRSTAFGANVAEVHGLLESSFGFNLEAILQLADGSIEHWYRQDGGWSLAERIA